MDQQAFTTLEYQQLKALIRRTAQTAAGKASCDELTPISQPAELQHSLAALAECVALRNRGVVWSFTEFADPEEQLGLLRVAGAALDPVALLQLARICEQALSARAAILNERESAPTLWQLVEALPRDLNSLVARVTNKILPSGELDDRASTEMESIRHEITVLR